MSQLPQRFLLSDQTARILREGVEQGRWTGHLPSEAELCRELQVSRVTLRRALERLVREQLIRAGGRGRHHVIVREVTAPTGVAGHTVRLLVPYPLHELGSANHAALDKLTEQISGRGYRLEFEHRPRLFQQAQTPELERLDALPDTAGWILLFSTAPIQEWFAARRRPCVVLGRLHEGVELASIYPDTTAGARHAAGLFFQRGHREVVYLMAHFTSLGDRMGARIFVEEMRRLGGRARVVEHDAEPGPLRETLRGLLAGRPRPTAFYSGCPEHCLTTLCHLLQAGLRVPEDAAIISGWDDQFLRYAAPSVAHYRVDGAELGRKAATLLLDLLSEGPGKVRTVRVLPKFVPGESLGAA